ncbi:MAG: FAD-linked oxidase, partial [Kocuria rhizophila]
MTAKVSQDTWRSWGKNLTVQPAAIVRPENTDQVEQVLRDAAAQGLRVRPAGSGQSFSPLVPTSDVLLDATALTGLSSIDTEKQQATFFGGTTIQQISHILEENGLALANMPDFTGQTIAGAIATGTHGTGLGQPSLSEQIIEITIATPSGELITCSETS